MGKSDILIDQLTGEISGLLRKSLNGLGSAHYHVDSVNLNGKRIADNLDWVTGDYEIGLEDDDDLSDFAETILKEERPKRKTDVKIDNMSYYYRSKTETRPSQTQYSKPQPAKKEEPKKHVCDPEFIGTKKDVTAESKKRIEELRNQTVGVASISGDGRDDIVCGDSGRPSVSFDNSHQIQSLADEYVNSIDKSLPVGKKFTLTRESVLNLVNNAFKKGFNSRL